MPTAAAFLWDARSLRYRNSASGRYIPDSAVRDAVESYTDSIAAEMRRISERLSSGRIGVDRWHRLMRGLIKDATLAGAMIGKGGRRGLSKKDIEAAEAEIAFQFGYLRDFAKEIRSGGLDPEVSGAAIAARASMYAGAATKGFWTARRMAAKAAGYTQEMRVLDPVSDHCDPCQGYADRGWVKIGTLPGIGVKCRCRSRCRCGFRFRRRAA